MDTKSKNKVPAIISFIIGVLFITSALVFCVDFINHRDYIVKDAYFKNAKFEWKVYKLFLSIDELLRNSKASSSSVSVKKSNPTYIMTEQIIKGKEKGAKAVTIQIIKDTNPLKYYIENKDTKEIITNIQEGIQLDIKKYISQNSLFSLKFPQSSSHSANLSKISEYFGKLGAEAYFIVPKDISIYNQIHKDYLYYDSVKIRVTYEGIFGVILLAIGIVLLIVASKFNLDVIICCTRKHKRIPIDIRIVILWVAITTALTYIAKTSIFYLPIDSGQILNIGFIDVLLGISLLLLFDFTYLLRNSAMLKQELEHSFLKMLYFVWKDHFINWKEIVRVILVLFCTTIIGSLITHWESVTSNSNGQAIVGLIVAAYFLILPYYIVQKMFFLNQIMKGSEEIVSGNYDYTIDDVANGKLSKLARNINHVKDGLKNSLESQMKSERLKAELITNVSHDLKTPLTSIMNYVDLLKRKDISKEEIENHVEVLERKTKRLNVLIEDLFEISKISSGEIELHKEEIDVCSLLEQTLAELNEKILASSLIFIVNIPQNKITAELDGIKTWRVFDNLINNILKYSLKGTRVYIDMIKIEQKVFIVFKNISSYQIDFDSSEIFERFKRGDKSRNTEGSGLGLAIAKSIVEMEGGLLTVDVDGDLFKATIEFDCI